MTARQVGVYRFAERLGAGGMGEVYRAHDSRLERDVAIKILPQTFNADPERRERLEREARMLAALNHPNIGAIYGVEDLDDGPALVLELVPGDTLADRIRRGPLGLPEILKVAAQIAAALECAHARGIVHRDLKPANVKVAPDGVVKVLDFGLAKAVADDGLLNADLTAAPTAAASLGLTGQGALLGTVAYMSPEQARGVAVDGRSDIWAFGCVLYEMLSGRQAFTGATAADVLAAVLNRTPDWTALPPRVPSSLTRLLRRCLEKEPGRRLRHIGDAQLDLEEAATPGDLAPGPPPRPGGVRRPWVVAGAAMVATALVASLIGAFTNRDPTVSRTVRLALIPTSEQPLAVSDADRDFVVSRAGDRVIYVSGREGALMVRATDRLDALRLGNVTGARNPFLSPDGQWVGFFVGVSTTELKKIAITGGPAISLCRAPGGAHGAVWGADDTIVFATSPGRLLRIPASGGDPTVLSTPDAAGGETGHLFPSLLPDGRTVLMTVTSVGNPLEGSQIVALDIATGRRTVLINGGTQPGYVESGHLIYGAAGALRAVRFDAKTLEVRGEPVPVVDRVATFATTGAVEYSLSPGGTLVYLPGDVLGATRSLVWVDRNGREEPIDAPPRMYSYVRLSPDGTRVALDVRDREEDIWIWDFARHTLTQLTTGAGLDTWPVWTADGRRVIFQSRRSGPVPSLFWQPADGTGAAEPLPIAATTSIWATSVSGVGNRLLVHGPNRLGFVRLGDHSSTTGNVPREFEAVTRTPFSVGPRSSLSSDGRWLAYESADAEPQVYVRPFPNGDDGSWQVSVDGGTRALWARRGNELFYRDRAGAIVAVPVRTSPGFSAGRPQRLFSGRYLAAGSGQTYDVAPDGQRFLMIKDVATNQLATNLVVVLNWAEELRRLLPAN